MKAAVAKIQASSTIEDFAHEFKSFDEWISKKSLFAHLWNEFKETLVMPDATDPKPIICNTMEASSCFNEHTIVSEHVNLRFYNSMPNFLTGAGILGTFIGLVAGIYLASSGLTSANAQELHQSLENLLSGAALAFSTSIVGIFTSIIFSWREKALTHSLHKFIGKWNEEVDKRIKRLTYESLAQRQLGQLIKQSEFLEEFTTKVAFNIADALNDRMNEKLVPVLEQLINSLQLMRKEQSDTNDQILKDIVDKFTESLSGAAGKEMSSMSDTLLSLNKTLTPLLIEMQHTHKQMQGAAIYISEQIKESYKESSDSFKEGIQSAISELKEGITKAGNVLNEGLESSFHAAIERLENNISSLDKNLTNLNNAGANTRDIVQKTGSILDKFREVSDSLGKTQLNLNTLITNLVNSSKRISAGTEIISNAMIHFDATQTKIQSITSEFEKIQRELQQVWRSYSERFENLDNSLENVFNKINEGLKVYAEATKKYMAELDNSSSKVTGLFSSAVSEFGEAIDELSEVMSNVSDR